MSKYLDDYGNLRLIPLQMFAVCLQRVDVLTWFSLRIPGSREMRNILLFGATSQWRFGTRYAEETSGSVDPRAALKVRKYIDQKTFVIVIESTNLYRASFKKLAHQAF